MKTLKTIALLGLLTSAYAEVWDQPLKQLKKKKSLAWNA